MPEILYPGVYLTEVAFEATSISGVPTSTDGFTAGIDAARVSVPSGGIASPEWTDANLHDPGTTLLELLAYSLQDLRFTATPAGIVNGLGVGAATDREPPVTASAGLAVSGDGQAIAPDSGRAGESVRRWPWP